MQRVRVNTMHSKDEAGVFDHIQIDFSNVGFRYATHSDTRRRVRAFFFLIHTLTLHLYLIFHISLSLCEIVWPTGKFLCNEILVKRLYIANKKLEFTFFFDFEFLKKLMYFCDFEKKNRPEIVHMIQSIFE